MAFLKSSNKRLLPTFANIADWYKHHGRIWKVRWDYAFYQMLIETNFLKFRAPNGRRGDVSPRQNNFAGIGTTGGGVPGNSFADVSTGVLAQIQHLVVYSGEYIPKPVAPRTRLKQDLILRLSRPVAKRRPGTVQDVSGRGAVDRKDGRSIEYIARRYRKRYCRDAQRSPIKPSPTSVQHASTTDQSTLPSVGPKAHSTLPQSCKVQEASFGGPRYLLIRSMDGPHVQLTTLGVKQGQEDELARKFIADFNGGKGQAIASFSSETDALKQAHRMCKDLVR
ncbi:MAG: hypothetical protein ACR2PG_05235 [Hyphomicrobiaceae bacterium]